jgi:hypothetical protein
VPVDGHEEEVEVAAVVHVHGGGELAGELLLGPCYDVVGGVEGREREGVGGEALRGDKAGTLRRPGSDDWRVFLRRFIAWCRALFAVPIVAGRRWTFAKGDDTVDSPDVPAGRKRRRAH